MPKLKLKESLPLIGGQTFLFVCIQKLFFGINAWEPPKEYGISVYDYYGVFLFIFAFFMLGISLFLARRNAIKASSKLIAFSGMMSFVVSVCLLFDVLDFLPYPLGLYGLGICLAILCMCFCIILFAWLTRLVQVASVTGAKYVLRSIYKKLEIHSKQELIDTVNRTMGIDA